MINDCFAIDISKKISKIKNKNTKIFLFQLKVNYNLSKLKMNDLLNVIIANKPLLKMQVIYILN